MNELVKRLSRKQKVRLSRIAHTREELDQLFELGYGHILFEKTGTELNIKLDAVATEVAADALTKLEGNLHLEGAITLNYDKVKVVADVDLKTLEGTGKVVQLNDEHYASIMS